MGIRNPLGSRNHSTKRIAGIKIGIVWVMAMIVSSSITVLGKVFHEFSATISFCGYIFKDFYQ